MDDLERIPGGLPNEVEGGLIIRDKNGTPTGVFVSIDPRPSKTQAEM